MKVLPPELASRVLDVLGRLIDNDGQAFTRDTEVAAALGEGGWVVGLVHGGYAGIVWRVSSPARALADARALLDEVSA